MGLDSATAWAATAAGFTGGAFALVRFAMIEYRSATKQFTDYLERVLEKQQAMNVDFRRSLDRLAETVESWRPPVS